MSNGLPDKFPVVDLSTIYDPAIMGQTYYNLGEILGEEERPGTWDNVYSALKPFTQVNLQGETLAGLVDPHNNPVPLSQLFGTLDASGVIISTVAPIARLVEEYLFYKEAKTPTQYLEERRKKDLESLKTYITYLKAVKDIKDYWEALPGSPNTNLPGWKEIEAIYGVQ